MISSHEPWPKHKPILVSSELWFGERLILAPSRLPGKPWCLIDAGLLCNKSIYAIKPVPSSPAHHRCLRNNSCWWHFFLWVTSFIPLTLAGSDASPSVPLFPPFSALVPVKGYHILSLMPFSPSLVWLRWMSFCYFNILKTVLPHALSTLSHDWF